MSQISTQANPLGTARIGKLMVKFAVPSVIAMSVNSLYNMVDQVFIGQGVNYLGNAATNVVLPLSMVLLAVSFMIGDGAAAHMSLKLGEGKADKAAKGVGNSVVMLLIACIVLEIVFLIFLEPLCRLFGATDNVLPYALDFGLVIVLGFPVGCLCAGLGGVIRADGRPTTTMVGLLIGFVVNITLNPLFIFVFGWGVTGSALATVIGQACNAVFFGVCFFRFKTITLNRRCFILEARVCGRILLLGVSSFITNFVSVFVIFVMNNIIVEFGALSRFGSDIALAAFGVVIKVTNLLTGIALGLAVGMQPVFGFNYGSGQYERVKRAFKLSVIVSVVVLVVAFIIFQVFPLQITYLFETESQLYMDFSVMCFRIMTLAIVAVGPGMVCGVFFQSIGMPLQASVLSVSRQALFLIPSALILSSLFGIEGALWSSPVSDALACAMGLSMVRAYWNKIFDSQKHVESQAVAGGE